MWLQIKHTSIIQNRRRDDKMRRTLYAVRPSKLQHLSKTVVSLKFRFENCRKSNFEIRTRIRVDENSSCVPETAARRNSAEQGSDKCNIFPRCDLYIQWNTYSLRPVIQPDIVYYCFCSLLSGLACWLRGLVRRIRPWSQPSHPACVILFSCYIWLSNTLQTFRVLLHFTFNLSTVLIHFFRGLVTG